MATEHDDYEDDFHSESEDESKRRSPAKASRGGAGSGAGAGGAAASYVDRRADDVNAASSSKEAEERDTEDKEEHGWEEVAFSEVELGPKPIGGGGFALVYKGEWRGRRVAVKTLVGSAPPRFHCRPPSDWTCGDSSSHRLGPPCLVCCAV